MSYYRSYMSDREIIYINQEQWERLNLLLGGIHGSLEKLGDFALKDEFRTIADAIDRQTIDTGKWLGLIVEAIKSITPLPPQPQPPKGVIMATFKVGADNPDITIGLTGSGFTDNDVPPNPVGAEDIDLSVESSAPDVVSATITDQTLSDDGKSVSANVAVHFGAAASDIAVLTYRATNRDTGLVVAAGTDEFNVQAGEAALGSLTSNVPLTPEP